MSHSSKDIFFFILFPLSIKLKEENEMQKKCPEFWNALYMSLIKN